MPASPAMLPRSVLTAPHTRPRQMQSRFPVAEAHDLCHSILRRHGAQHIDVICHHVACGNLALPLCYQDMQDLPMIRASAFRSPC